MKSLKILLLLLAANFLQAQNDGPVRDLKLVSVQNFSDLQDNRTIRYDAIITNAGNIPIELANVVLQNHLSKDAVAGNADDVIAGGAVIRAADAAMLQPGETRTLVGYNFSYNGKPLADFPFVVVKIDQTNVLAEANENNNRLIVEHGFPLKPDLHAVVNSGGLIEFRQEGAFVFFKVKNSGLVASPKAACTFQYLTGGTQPVTTMTIPAIPAGGEVEVKAPGANHPCSPSCKFRFKIDINSKIKESNENNNQADGVILG